MPSELTLIWPWLCCQHFMQCGPPRYPPINHPAKHRGGASYFMGDISLWCHSGIHLMFLDTARSKGRHRHTLRLKSVSLIKGGKKIEYSFLNLYAGDILQIES